MTHAALSFAFGEGRRLLRQGFVLTGLLGALACQPEPVVINYQEEIDLSPIEELPGAPQVQPVDPDGLLPLSGYVRNWVTNDYVGDAQISSYGLATTLEATGDPGGAYSVDVPVAGVFWARTYKQNYAPTYNRINMPAQAYQKDIYAISAADLGTLQAAFGVVQNPDCGMVFVTAKNAANQPQANVDSVELNGFDAQGPYYLDALGNPDPNATYTSSSGRIVFFNVADQGQASLTERAVVPVTALEGTYTGAPAFVNVFRDSVTVTDYAVVEGEQPPPPPPQAIVDFPTEIYPLFTAMACAACHYRGGQADGSGLYFSDPPETLYAALRANTDVVNLQDPEASYLLYYPLFADPPNGGHPNASYPTVNDPNYVAIKQWIEGGAVWGVEPPPPPVEPVYFDAVYERFQTFDATNAPYGRGCADCHNADTYSGGLDLTGGQVVVHQRLVDKNLYDVNYPERSSILRNPYCGPDYCAADPQYPETHPTRVFVQTTDPDYQLIYQWIAQGAYFDPNLVDEPPPPPDPNIPTQVYFSEKIQYRFATRGCLGCHSKADARGGLVLEGSPSEVYQTISDNNLVVANDYANSPLYTKVNAEYPDINHGGGKTIPNAQDPYALYLRGWIEEGAAFDNPPYVDFEQDVLAAFASLGCTGCHDANATQGGLALAYQAGAAYPDPQSIYDELTGDNTLAADGYIANSYIITKAFDLYPNVNHGGGKKAVAQYYNEFQTLSNWINEGLRRAANQ